ncbi:unnamed protein product, partial [Ceratitis capitata]
AIRKITTQQQQQKRISVALTVTNDFFHRLDHSISNSMRIEATHALSYYLFANALRYGFVGLMEMISAK